MRGKRSHRNGKRIHDIPAQIRADEFWGAGQPDRTRAMTKVLGELCQHYVFECHIAAYTWGLAPVHGWAGRELIKKCGRQAHPDGFGEALHDGLEMEFYRRL